MLIAYSILSGICVVIAVTGLLKEPLKRKHNAILILYITIMAIIANMYFGQLFGLLMVGILLVLIYVLSEENKIQSVFFACIGYLINLLCNNGLLYFLATVFGISADQIQEKYWLFFSVFYALILKGIFILLHGIIYNNLNVVELFSRTQKTIQYSLAANMILFVVIFIVNISLGEKAGYSKKCLWFNCILFFVCMIVSSKVIIECTKGVENAERKKAAAHQYEILKNYVASLERMLEEMRAFRHDYKNILATMAGYIHENQMEELRAFFSEKIQSSPWESEKQMEAWKYLNKIEPMDLKGFLYEKLLLILSKNISVQINISENINGKYRSMDDLIRILGIFIDNAVEEAEKSSDGKISIIIADTKLGLLFCVENNYEVMPDLSLIGTKGYSTKGEGRGTGLYWAENTIKKHNDMYHEMSIQNDRMQQRLEVVVD